MGTQGRDGNGFTLTEEPGGSTHFLTVSVKGGEVRIESYGGKWWKLMCVKHPTEGGLSLERGCLSGPRAAQRHGSAGAYGPPLIPPTHSLFLLLLFSPFNCGLENGSIKFKKKKKKKIEALRVVFSDLTFI